MAILWNKVTWYSKLSALVFFILFAAFMFWFGCALGYLNGFSIGSSASAPALRSGMSSSGGMNSGYYENVSAWPTDQANGGGFTFQYPLDFMTDDSYAAAPSMNWSLDADGTSGNLWTTLTIPATFEPQTNFADATLTVGDSENATAVTQCLADEGSGGPVLATSTQNINGIAFTVFQSSGAGAGNLYQTTSYRTIHDGQCWAIEYTIHSTQIANYPPQYDLQPFDENEIAAVLNRIVGTFKFQ